MKINNISIMSQTALDFEIKEVKPITILRGEHSVLALDIIREVIGECGLMCDPDSVDDGRFIVHADVDIDGKNYSACYIRSADFLGDNRIAVNFKPNSIEYSKDDTIEYLEKCKEMNSDKRPVFIYPTLGDKKNIVELVQSLSCDDRQVFIAIPEEFSEINHDNIMNVFVN